VCRRHGPGPRSQARSSRPPGIGPPGAGACLGASPRHPNPAERSEAIGERRRGTPAARLRLWEGVEGYRRLTELLFRTGLWPMRPRVRG